MIRLEHVTKCFAENTAVDDVSLEIKAGELAILLGPSGCGKTTTLRSINRMTDIDSGTIFVDDINVLEQQPDELRRRIGYVIQSIGLFPHLTIARNVATVPRLLGWDAERTNKRVNELLEMVGLDPALYAMKHPRELSGGEQQRVGVARALAADPAVLLMDEPFGALDPLSRQRLQVEFRALQRELGTTVVFVTHDIEEAVLLGDRIALMDHGRLIQFDRPETLWLSPATPFVSSFFGEEFALKILSRHTVFGIALERVSPDGLAQVTAETSLKDALATMVSSGRDALSVSDGLGGSAGVLTFSALVHAVKE
ncbi:MAG: glycine/betaine ABC transporter [Actinobacteria bacterium HGW-Actinobacteria-7]|nr:MAG: glycine/betaine ABC transporter [Actinobacteria bacterium HGW-Actinobacteria-7]